MKNISEDLSAVYHLYERLLKEVKPALEKILEEKEIDLFAIEGRVKTPKSIESKITKKSYNSPLEQIEDLCGLRVICYYTSDLDIIEKLINDEFNVLSTSNKQEEMDVDRFGYSSRHFIVTLKENWLQTPLYRGLKDLKVEIQIRTMLMHSWAAISHKLLYKNEEDAPRDVKRNLSKLSALIELADEQFDVVKGIKAQYQKSIATNTQKKQQHEPINSDNLISLIEKYSPNRKYDNDEVPKVLEEIKKYDNYIDEFERRILRCLPVIHDMEIEEAVHNENSQIPMWNVSGFCRTVLDLTSDDYYSRWEGTNIPSLSITENYRNKIN